MKKLLITGQRGLLGSACVRYFKNKYDIFTSDRCNLIETAQTYRMINMIRPDVIIHCAAKVGGVKANRDFPVDFMKDNVRMQCTIMEAAHDCNVPILVNIATSCMFPKDALLPVEESSLFTGKLEDSVEAYAMAKICGWRLAKAYWEQYGRKYMTVAPSNIFGPQDNYSEEAHVIPALIRRFDKCVKEKSNMEVWGNGSAVREFIYSDDVASAIETVIEKCQSPEVINIGTGKGTSIRELTNWIMEQSPYSWRPEIKWNLQEPVGIPRKTFSIKKMSDFGWNPKISIEEGLKLTWVDFLGNKPRGI